jgi:hypothetical protein
MISLKALSDAGLSNKRLRQILESRPPEPQGKKRVVAPKNSVNKGSTFTGSTVATPITLEQLPDKPTDWDRRCYLETMVRGEILEGQMRCAANFDKFSAADLAYASIPIHPLVTDLMRVAMGYVSLEQCEANIAGMSDVAKNVFFERDGRGKVTGVNRPKLIPVAHNLVHSLVTRRVAALATEVYQQFPVLKYDTFSNMETARLGGDVMTQIAEQMAGMFGYRHDYEESIRQASLYTNSFKFKANAWFVDRQTIPEYPAQNGASKAGRAVEPKLKRKIVKEGVLFKLPHPSRVYYDISEPLSKLNNDAGGPKWIGHWEVVPIGSVIDNPAFYNTDVLTLDIDLYSWMGSYGAYFSQYYNGCATLRNAERINPTCNRGFTSAAALSLANDREANIGAWAQSYRASSTVLTQHYKCIVPKDHGLGTYEDPVWIRFVMAANTTIVFAEVLGSAPCSVNSYNASDGLLMSPSFAMQAIQWQQDLTNDLNELAHITAQGLVRIWVINTDGMKKEEIDLVENALKNPDFAELKDVVIKYKKSLLEQRAENPQNITEKIQQIHIDTASKTTEIFNRMVQKLALAERLMFFSPSELGQVSPRTTTATEQKAVQNTTLGIRDFHLIGVKQMMDADKRIIHDSYMAFGSEDLEVPVAERYEPTVIEAAGFTIVEDGTGNPPDGLFTIRGKKLGLLYNYIYTTRNTDDTPPEAQVAQGIAQVYEIMAKDPVISENTTLDQRYEFVNSLMNYLAPGLSKLRVPPGVDGKTTTGGAVKAMQDQMKQILPQIGQQLKALSDQQAQQAQKIGQLDAGQTALAAALNKLSSVLEAKAPVVPATPPSLPAGPAMPGGRQNAPGQPIAGTTPTLRPRSRATAVPLIG